MKKSTRIWLYFVMFSGIFLMVMASCSKKSDSPSSTVPELTTTTVTSITEISANSGGNVTSTGGSLVINWGICWSTSANPTVSDSKAGGGASTSNFTCAMSGLNGNTLYYVRAFATNSKGATGYGDQKSFTTLTFSHPIFSIRSTTDNTGFGLQFFARCVNDNVKMTKVMITDPENVETITYNLNDNTYVKNQEFGLQDPGTKYSKLVGRWTFEFIGTRTVDGSSFDLTFTLFV